MVKNYPEEVEEQVDKSILNRISRRQASRSWHLPIHAVQQRNQRVIFGPLFVGV